MSSSTGTNGEPVWASGDAPSIAASFNELSAFALKRGGLLRGTTAEREAFATTTYAREGDHWYDTTLGELLVYTGTAWESVLSDTGWVTVPPGAGVTVQQTIQRRVKDGIVYVRGQATTNASQNVLFTLPAGSRPGVARRFGMLSGTSGATGTVLALSADGSAVVPFSTLVNIDLVFPAEN